MVDSTGYESLLLLKLLWMKNWKFQINCWTLYAVYRWRYENWLKFALVELLSLIRTKLSSLNLKLNLVCFAHLFAVIFVISCLINCQTFLNDNYFSIQNLIKHFSICAHFHYNYTITLMCSPENLNCGNIFHLIREKPTF